MSRSIIRHFYRPCCTNLLVTLSNNVIVTCKVYLRCGCIQSALLFVAMGSLGAADLTCYYTESQNTDIRPANPLADGAAETLCPGYRTETDTADQTCHFTQSLCNRVGPTSSGTDRIIYRQAFGRLAIRSRVLISNPWYDSTVSTRSSALKVDDLPACHLLVKRGSPVAYYMIDLGVS